MAAVKMHAGEIETDVGLVRRLLAAQFLQWADLTVEPVASYETDHDIYRLGEHLAARLLRIGWATEHHSGTQAEAGLDGALVEKGARATTPRAARHALALTPATAARAS